MRFLKQFAYLWMGNLETKLYYLMASPRSVESSPYPSWSLTSHARWLPPLSSALMFLRGPHHHPHHLFHLGFADSTLSALCPLWHCSSCLVIPNMLPQNLFSDDELYCFQIFYFCILAVSFW